MENENLPEVASREKASIAGVYIEPEFQGARANAWIYVEVENHTHEEQQALATVIVRLGENQEKIEVVEWIEPQGAVIEAVVRIEEPELWWPAGFGEQVLYTCMVGLSVDGEVQDVQQERFGVRSIRLLEGRDPAVLLIDGEEIVSDPELWAPPDQFVPSAGRERYRKLVAEARDAGAVMIKAWGEGSEDDSAFYDTCDEMGMLVWQELLPEAVGSPSGELAGIVAEHVGEHIRNLRNHPSIVVWCAASGAPEQPGNVLVDEIIPRTVASLDRTRPCISRCPDPFSEAQD